ncbi:MAG: RluA family pseudouridine synthase [Deltaproteobacteria bacterium]|nr:RluA family pseudouridine synthase [Deltaproteobacteria bacterium]
MPQSPHLPEELDGEVALPVEAGDAGNRLDRFLSARVGALTRSQAQRAIRLDLVTVDGVVACKTGLPVRAGQEVIFVPPPAMPSKAVPQDIPLDIIYEDEAITVIAKRAGMVVHPAAGHPDGTLVNALLGRYPEMQRLDSLRPGVVHRLDRGTSGLLVVARTAQAREALSEQFLARSVAKGYVAVVAGFLRQDEGCIDREIGRHRVERKRFTAIDPAPPTRSATTLWRVAAEGLAPFALLAIRILTGRTHQIRVHLAAIGHPVAGDALYGNGRLPTPLAELPPPDGGRPLLHAAWLAFDHPLSRERLSFHAPLPADMAAVAALMFPGFPEKRLAEEAFYPQPPTPAGGGR